MLIDGVLLYVLQKQQMEQHEEELEHSAARITSAIMTQLETGISLSEKIYTDLSIYEFVNHDYVGDDNYYTTFYDFNKSSRMNYVKSIPPIKQVSIYTTNDTILEGLGFYHLDTQSKLYDQFQQLNQNQTVHIVVEATQDSNSSESEINITLLRQLNYYSTNTQNYLCIELDMNELSNRLYDEFSIGEILILEGDLVVMATKKENLGTHRSVEDIIHQKDMTVCVKQVNRLNTVWTIAVFDKEPHIIETIQDYFIESSTIFFISITLLGIVIHITIVREHERQKLLLSVKQAEWIALNSQVKPHFLYNTLESICMRSVIKGERETSDVIRNLAVLMRYMSSWKNDMINLGEEIEFVSRYLSLQEYRFGDRLQYEIGVQKVCEDIQIPKLTIIPLVENACVHGMGHSLESGLITVQVQLISNTLHITVCDKGSGMEEEERLRIQKSLENASVEQLFENRGTGILNTYLRLKAYFQEAFDFSITSQVNEGTCVCIQIGGMKV